MGKFTGHPITDDSALGGSVIKRSLRFNSADTTYLSKSFASNGNRQTFTISCWIKKTHPTNRQVMVNQTATAGSNEDGLEFDGTQLRFYSYVGSNFVFQVATNRRFRDVNGWYHIVAVYDSPQATESNRAKVYINGTQETDLSTATYPSQNNTVGYFNTTTDELRIGNQKGNQYKLDGYMAEINFIDGTALDPSYFGYTEFQTGIWRPKRYEGTYGTNGFYLDFSDNSSTTTLGIDKSPNGNDFTANNFSVSAGADNDSFTDTPTSENKFAQLNSNLPTNSGASYRNGNYTFYMTHDNNHHRASSNMPVNSGKWYAEFKLTTYGFQSGSYPYIGVCADDLWINSWTGDAGTAYQTGGTIWRNGSSIESGHATYTQGDIISVAINLDSSPPQVWWAKNGTYIRNASANPATGAYGVNIEPASTTGYYNFAMSLWASTGQWDANFGQRAFSYDIPAGFKTLCTDNIRSNQNIIRPQKHFDTVLYTGDETSSRKISGLEFQPDLVWIKPRSTTSNHCLLDSVRGVHNRILPNSSGANVNNTSTITAFNVDGFQIGNSSLLNTNSATHVAWCWKAGGNSNTFNIDGVGYATAAAAGLDEGTANPTGASVNTEAGFSIVQFESQSSGDITLSHGLGKKPEFWMWKSVDNNIDWYNYHHSLGYNAWLNNSANNAAVTGNDAAWKAEPTSTVFTHGSGLVNQNTIIMYMWTSIPGYSKMGSYTGNGNSDGPYVHLGFRPAFVWIKCSSGTFNWMMYDSKRETSNVIDKYLMTNSANAEAGSTTDNPIDFLSDGFKLRYTNTSTNQSGGTYIYMAYAEEPGLTPYGITTNAR